MVLPLLLGILVLVVLFVFIKRKLIRSDKEEKSDGKETSGEERNQRKPPFYKNNNKTDEDESKGSIEDEEEIRDNDDSKSSSNKFSDSNSTSVTYAKDSENRQTGPIATDVTTPGRSHAVTLTEVKEDGTGVATFHGLVVFVMPFSNPGESHQVGDKVRVTVVDVGNKHARATPNEVL